MSIIIWLLAHIGLTIVIRDNPLMSTVHAIFVITTGLFFAFADKESHRTISVLGYIAGAEILWRGTDARIFWETGKYAIALLAVIRLLRHKAPPSIDKRPIFYFVLLLPSILIMPAFDRSQIAFNLAGPFALAVCIMIFSVTKINRIQLKNLLLSILAPTVSLAVLVALGIMSAESIEFAQGSLFETSGNIGPNQVSSVLGLGAMAAFLFIILEDNFTFLRIPMALIAVWLLAQAALTFSRGGFWNAILAVVPIMFLLIQDKSTRKIFFGVSIISVVIVNFFVYPALDRFTSGALATRFADYGSTGRIEIIKSDLVTFLEYPLFGVGPHQSKVKHAIFFRYSSAHTEYSRMLAEHGFFGLLSLLILVRMAAGRYITSISPLAKAMTVAFLTWGLLFMAHAATRLAAPSLLIGLAFATYTLQEIHHDDATI